VLFLDRAGKRPSLNQAMADKKEEVADVWNVVDFTTTEKPWSKKTFVERLIFLGVLFLKFVVMTLLLYLFIISLGLMANAFRILGGKTAGRTFRNSEVFDNPLAGIVIGILVTVLVQSSSTSTSIIITMTAGDLIKIQNAIPMIMGANIGTSVTNTIVSLGSFRDRDEYRRAFAGATVHDCFNFLTVFILLPIEAATGLLRHMAAGLCDAMGFSDEEEKGQKTDFLKKLTKPVGSRLLGIDKKLITAIAKEDDEEKLKEYDEQSIIKHKQKDDQHLFLDTPMSDGVAGVLMVFVALMFLCICLMLMVKVLQSIFRGRIAIWFRTAINLETPFAPFLANYILIVFGMGITILFQSSSVTTATLTPLVGIGLVKLEKMFAFTVGANIELQ
jgi:sodium-dependent phosphate cotransporter